MNPFLIREPDEFSAERKVQSAKWEGAIPNHATSRSPNSALSLPHAGSTTPNHSALCTLHSALPVTYRSFGDVGATRRAIFDRVQQAASCLSVVDNPRYALSLADVHYAEQDDPTPDDIKHTLLENGTIAKTLRGTWTLTDKTTGQQSHRKTVVAKVPYLLDNGTFLRNGTKYVLRNQSRLLPGVYARRKENGEHEVHVNADMRDGAIHHYGLDAETGRLHVTVSGSKTPIYGLARSMGATDEEMITTWGEELWRVNQKKFQESQISKLYERLARGKKEAKTDREKMDGIRESLERIKLNPEVMEATLGKPYDHLDKDVLLKATKKLIGISRGEEESDDRDNLAFQEVYGPEDIFEERLAKDSGAFRRMLLNNLTYRYGGNIEKLPAGALSKQIDGAILSSGLANGPEEINRLEIFDKAYSLTKLGQGGVPSIQSIPDESRDIHPSQRAYIDPSRTPESLRVGVDTYLATACVKGSDRRLYAPVIDRNGEQKMLRPRDLLRATVAVSSEFKRAADDDYIPVMQNGKEDLARKDEVDYLIPNFEGAFSPLANLIPFKSAAQGNRVAMGSRMLTQALPLNNGESPLVQSGIPGQPGRSYYQEFGRDAGAVFADQAGTVLEATDRHVLIENADGTKRKVNLDYYQPSNRKTASHQTPLVTIGQRINPGDIIAKSNMTDDQGQIALGMNANVIMMPWRGMNFEDGMLISESFAKRMTSQHMYQNRIDWSPEYKQGKHAFMGIFPSTFNRRQLDRMDDNGVVRVGEAVKSGDPLILAARSTEGGKKKGKRKLFSDATLTWDHHDDGVVTDVFHSDKGTAVLVKTESQMQEGDKLASRHGNKGVVRILPDDEMPRTKDGMVAEVVLSPAATVSRGNPVQLAELALGKIAKATGKTYRVADFDDIDDLYEFVNQELDKHGIEPDSPVIDPKTGREIYNGDGSGIANGSMWLMKLHHTSETKGSARGLGGYSADESPARGGSDGSKRIAPMHLNALVAHGAYNTFLDAKYHRGQANDDYWLQYMSGVNPQMKKTPLVYQKFENSLKASGIHVSPSEGRLNIMALTDGDIEKLAGDREIQSGETLRWEKDKNPIAGGLFDPTIFGMDGTRWGKMTPIIPILNPVMEEPARILLGLKQKELKAIMEGGMEYRNYGTGFQAIGKALDDISVPLAMNGYRAKMRNGKASERDNAVRALAYLKGCETTGIHPRDWMLSTIPILPPKFRPVSEMKDSNVPLIDDANYLYKLMIDTNNGIKELRNFTKNTVREEYGLYDAYKQVTGLAEPTHPKLVQRQVRGLLKHVFGVGSSKFSMVQRNLLGTPTDMVGRAVVTSDPDLDMDSVGIPEEKAWEVYRPHLVHRLTKRGIPWSQAARFIEDRSPVAKEALLKEMEERPVIMDRAPVLHKWGILALKPRLVAGDTVLMNQYVQKGYGLDADGDQQLAHVILRVKAKSLPSIATNLQWVNSLCKLHQNNLTQEKQQMAGYRELRVAGVDEEDRTFICHLQDFPHGHKIKESQGRCGRIDWYEIPEGVQILSYDEKTYRPVWTNPTVFSVHHGCEVIVVTTNNGKQIFTDDDPRAIYGINPETFEFERATPKEAKEKRFLIPRMRYVPANPGNLGLPNISTENYRPSGRLKRTVRPTHDIVPEIEVDFDLGYLLGVMIGDGWVSHSDGGSHQIYLADTEGFIAKEITRIITKYTSSSNSVHQYTLDMTSGAYGNSVRHRWAHTALGKLITDLVGHGCRHKHLPEWFIYGNKEFRLGLFAGLIDTDGGVGLGKAVTKKRPNLTVAYTTVNLRLAQEIQLLAASISISAKIGVGKTPVGLPVWNIGFSSRDIKKWGGVGLQSVIKKEKIEIAEVNFVGGSGNRMDTVPISYSLVASITNVIGSKTIPKNDEEWERKRLYGKIVVSRKGYPNEGKISRYLAKEILRVLKKYCLSVEHPHFDVWVRIVHRSGIVWDVIDKIENTGITEIGYDLTVPGYETFADSNGVILSNTMNFHVPSSSEAVQEAFNILLPSKSLIQSSDLRSAQPRIISENAGGLYLASLPPDKKQKPRTFVSWEDAKKAYHRGDLAIDEPVVVLSSRALPHNN